MHGKIIIASNTSQQVQAGFNTTYLMVFASNFDAAATVMRFLFLNSYMRHCMPKFRSQNEQSAAPPAIVPRRKGLISMTFLTVPEAMYAPMVERESTLTIIPPFHLKARVVVPLANFTVWLESLLPQAEAKLFRQKCAG